MSTFTNLFHQMIRMDRKYKIILLITMVAGILTHGMMMFNEYAFHDDLTELFVFGSTISSGRWMLRVFWKCAEFFLRGHVYAMPVFNGTLVLVLSGLCACLLAYLYQINNIVSCILLAVVMVAYPVVTALMGYMYCAPAYMIAVLMAIAAGVLICSVWRYGWKEIFLSKRLSGKIVLAIVLAACATGVYQSYICVTVAVVFFRIYLDVLEQNESVRKWLHECVIAVMTLALSLAAYLAAVQLSLKIYHMELSARQGINSYGITNIAGYLQRIALAYSEFFRPRLEQHYTIYILTMHSLYVVVLGVGILATIYYILRNRNSYSKTQLAVMAFMTVILPLASNFVLILIEESATRSLEMYSQLLLLVYFVKLYEMVEKPNWKHARMVSLLGAATLVYLCVAEIHIANICYLKSAFIQKQADSYLNTLITQIKSAKGYQPDQKIIYLGHNSLYDPSYSRVEDMDEFNGVELDPFGTDSVKNYNFDIYMKMWLGFWQDGIWDEDQIQEVESWPEVQAMPTYPSNDGIQVINDIIVVKFSNEY